MNRAIVIVAVAVVLFAGCSGGSKGGTPTAVSTETASTASPQTTASATTTQTVEMIGGVPVTPLHAGTPVDIPEGTVLYVEGGCTQCDGPATSLDRVYRDSTGVLRSDRLFERQLRHENNTTYIENYIRTMRVSSAGNEIVIGVCDRGYCGGVGNSTPDARTTFYGTHDGGITWTEMGQLGGDTWIIALLGPGVVVRHACQPSEGAPYKWELVQLPGGGPVVVDPVIDLRTANIVTVDDRTPLAVGPDGMSMLWMSGPVNGTPWLGLTLPAGSRILDGRISPSGGEGGVALVRWMRPGPGGTERSFLGLMKERQGNPATIYADTPDVSISFLGQWLAPSTLAGNATLPAATLEFPLAVSGSAQGVPSLTNLKTGAVRAIEPLIERRLNGDRARILAVVPGPFAKIARTGDCLNVRENPAQSSPTLGCFKDGVLLRLRPEPEQTAHGATWLAVATPDGRAGWASAEFLER